MTVSNQQSILLRRLKERGPVLLRWYVYILVGLFVIAFWLEKLC